MVNPNGNKYGEHGEEAERLYVEEGMGLSQISERLGVSEVTLRKWREFGDWNKQRNERRVKTKSARARMLDVVNARLTHLSGLNVADIRSPEIDEMSKLNKILQANTDPAELAGIAIKTLMKFTEHVKGTDEKLAAALAPLAAEFLDEIWEDSRK